MSDSCDPMVCSLSGSSVHGILQARILEWVAISFSEDLPNPGIKPRSPALQSDSLPAEPPGKLEWNLKSFVNWKKKNLCTEEFFLFALGHTLGYSFQKVWKFNSPLPHISVPHPYHMCLSWSPTCFVFSFRKMKMLWSIWPIVCNFSQKIIVLISEKLWFHHFQTVFHVH